MSTSSFISSFRGNTTTKMIDYISQNLDLFYLEEEFYSIDYDTIVSIMEKTSELKPDIVATIVKNMSKHHKFDPIEFLSHCNTDKTEVIQRLNDVDFSSIFEDHSNDMTIENNKKISSLEQAVKDQNNKIEALTERVMKLEAKVNMQNNPLLFYKANSNYYTNEKDETFFSPSSKSFLCNTDSRKLSSDEFNTNLQEQESFLNSFQNKITTDSIITLETLRRDNDFNYNINKLEKEIKNNERIKGDMAEYIDFKKDIIDQAKPSCHNKYDKSDYHKPNLNFLDYCGKGDIQAIIRLLNNNPSLIRLRSDHSGWRPLHVAVHHNQRKVAEILIKYGANVNDSDNYGRTPLFLAAQLNKVEMAELLIKCGADVHARTAKIYHFIMVIRLFKLL